MFHPFTRLPPELRFEIWRIAYTEWTVKVVSPRHIDRHERPGRDAALAIGQSCYEARLAVESVLNKVELTTCGTSIRVHFPTSILFFGPATEALMAIKWASDAACSSINHVAFIWTSHRGVRDCFQQLGQRFTSIASVTVFLADGKYTNMSPRALADRDYADLIATAGHRVARKPWNSSWTDIDKLTRLMSSWLGSGPLSPRVNILPLS